MLGFLNREKKNKLKEIGAEKIKEQYNNMTDEQKAQVKEIGKNTNEMQNMSAAEYNRKAQELGDKNWNTAYRRDILGIDDSQQQIQSQQQTVQNNSQTQTVQNQQQTESETPQVYRDLKKGYVDAYGNKIANPNTQNTNNGDIQAQNIQNDQTQAESQNNAVTEQNNESKNEGEQEKSENGNNQQNQFQNQPVDYKNWTVDNWKARGSKPDELENAIEQKYNTIAERDENGNLTAVIGGNKYKWTIDSWGNPRKENLGPVNKGEIAMAGFDELIGKNASIDELQDYVKDNLKDLDQKKVVGKLKDYFKNKNRNDFVQKYGNLNPQELHKLVQTGEIVPGSAQFNMLPNAQAYYQMMPQFLTIDSAKKMDFEKFNNQIALDNIDYIANHLKENYLSTQAIEKAHEQYKNDPRNLKSHEEIMRLQKEIADLDQAMERSDKDVEERLQGAPKSLVYAEQARQKEALMSEKTRLMKYMQAETGFIANRREDFQVELGLIEYQDKMKMQQYTQSLDLFRNERGRLDILKQQAQTREDKEKYYKMDREWEMKKFEIQQKSQEIAFNRQKSWEKERMELQEKYKGGSYQTDLNGNLLYIKDNVATNVKRIDGTLVATTISKNYEDQIFQNKDGTFDVMRVYNNGKTPDRFSYGANGSMPNNGSLDIWGAISTISEKGSHPSGGLRCGEGVNRYLKGIGITDINIGSDYSEKTKYIDPENGHIPQVGGLAVWNPGGKIKEHGHIGIVTGYNEKTGKVEITDWNYSNDNGGIGDGKQRTHDVDIRTINSNGGFIHVGEDVEDVIEIGYGDIQTFNNPTYKGYKSTETPEEKAKYDLFLKQKNSVMQDPQASMEDILRFSAGGKELDATALGQVEKFDSVVSQLGALQKKITKMNTGPIVGKLKSVNPWDTDAQVLKAQLTALIPELARGVYGEVGVLTDNDIRLYSQTIPNLNSTNDVNKAIMAMTLKVVAGGYKKKLQSYAAGGRDVSGYQGLYTNLMSQVSQIERDLGMYDNAVMRTQTNNVKEIYENYKKNNTQKTRDITDTEAEKYFTY